MLTTEQIAAAKRIVRYSSSTPRHEHDDCIQIAYQWLDAQAKNQTKTASHYIALKHVIQAWGGRYVSRDDVEVAAHLHPHVFGCYPNFNLGKRRVLPSFTRLHSIAEAGTMLSYRGNLHEEIYASHEDGATIASGT